MTPEPRSDVGPTDGADPSDEPLLLARTPDVLAARGVRGGCLRFAPGGADSVLVVRTRATGAKRRFARWCGDFASLGVDLVHACVNDVLAAGAFPRAFVPTFVGGTPSDDERTDALAGVARGCRANDVALLGNDAPDAGNDAGSDWDLCGTLLGVATEPRVLAKGLLAAGDRLVGLVASGLHSAGFLGAMDAVRGRLGLELGGALAGTGTTVERALLAVHKSYYGIFEGPIAEGWLHGLVPVVEGGLLGSLERATPAGLGVEVEMGSWEVPGLFETLRSALALDDQALVRAFNAGIGLVAVVPPERAEDLDKILNAWNEPHWGIGRVVEAPAGVRLV